MRYLIQNFKRYLNEKTFATGRKRYKSIGILFCTQGILLFFFIWAVYFFIKSIIQPISNHVPVFEIQYDIVLITLFGGLGCILMTWMFGINATVATFCSEKRKEFCHRNNRPYFKRFFFPFYSDQKKQVKLEWSFYLLSMFLCIFMIKAPDSLHIRANQKITAHYGYVYCQLLQTI